MVSHEIGLVNIDNQGIAGMEKWLDGQGLAALHMAGLASDRLQRRSSSRVDLRVQFAMRDELVKAREKFKAQGRRRPRSSTSTPARSSRWCRSRTSIRTIRSEANDPTRINRLTTGVYEMGSTFKVADAGDGARFRQGDAELDVRRAHAAALRPASPSTTTSRRTAC